MSNNQRAGVSLVVITMLLAACGRMTHTDVTHPTGGREIVLRVATTGGLLPPEGRAAAIPGFNLYGDGTLITLGPQIEIYPPPALPPLERRRLEPEGIRALLAEAERAGLFGNHTYQGLAPTVADAPTTTFTVVAGGQTFTTSVYALGLDDDPDPGDPEAKARSKIQAFTNRLFDPTRLPGGVSEPEIYEPEAMRIYVLPYERESPELRQNPIAWPLVTPLSNFGAPSELLPNARCGVVAGQELVRLLPLASQANTLSPWVSDGNRYTLILRPLLPDESGCYVEDRTTRPTT